MFEKELKSKGERLLLDSYIPTEGTYIIVTEENSNFIIKDENIIEIKYDKKTKEPMNSESELNRVREKDYYSMRKNKSQKNMACFLCCIQYRIEKFL